MLSPLATFNLGGVNITLTDHSGYWGFIYFPINFKKRPTVISQYCDYSGSNNTFTAAVTAEQAGLTYVVTNASGGNAVTVSYIAVGQ